MLIISLIDNGHFRLSEYPERIISDITVPYVMVEIHHDGISPEDADRLLIQPTEKYLKSLEGLKLLQ